MTDGAVHTVHRDGHWFNVIEGQAGVLDGPYEYQKDAVDSGEREAAERHVEHMIHGLDGQIHQRNYFGDDPLHHARR